MWLHRAESIVLVLIAVVGSVFVFSLLGSRAETTPTATLTLTSTPTVRPAWGRVSFYGNTSSNSSSGGASNSFSELIGTVRRHCGPR